MPKAEWQRIRDTEFLWNVLEQKNISEKNIEYLRAMALRYQGELGERAAALAELGLVHPRKRKRGGFLRLQKPEMYASLIRLGLIEDEKSIDAFDNEILLTETPFGEFSEYAEPHEVDLGREPDPRNYADNECIPF